MGLTVISSQGWCFLGPPPNSAPATQVFMSGSAAGQLKLSHQLTIPYSPHLPPKALPFPGHPLVLSALGPLLSQVLHLGCAGPCLLEACHFRCTGKAASFGELSRGLAPHLLPSL